MAQPARRQDVVDESLELDPVAVQRAYQLHRARRRAHRHRRRETKRAQVRFWLVLVVLRELGIELPATVPEPLVVIVLGSLATILVLVRLISVPDAFYPNDGR